MSHRQLSRTEETILDALHFVLSYEELKQETRLNTDTLDEELARLTAEGIVERLLWNEPKKEYLPIELCEPDAVAGKSMQAFHFLATKKGLFLHHSK